MSLERSFRAKNLATQLLSCLNPKQGAAAPIQCLPKAPAAPRLRFRAFGGEESHTGRDIMASIAAATNTNSILISGIRNLVCPLCGASMMGFHCLGYCGSDWRQEWERAISARSKSGGPRSGRTCAKYRL